MIENPDQVEALILGAIAWVVTDDEHTRLTALGEQYQGWDRYVAAGIDVFDEQERVFLIKDGQFVERQPEPARGS